MFLIMSSPFPFKALHENDTKVALCIAPCPSPALPPPTSVTVCQLEVFVSGGSQQAVLTSRHIRALGGGRYLILLNAGDAVRLLEAAIVTSPTVEVDEKRRKEVGGEQEARGGGYSRSSVPHCFESLVVMAESSWWDSLEPLDPRDEVVRQGLEPGLGAGAGETLPTHTSVAVVQQWSFDVETFVGQVLRTQTRRLDGTVLDYDVQVLEPIIDFLNPVPGHELRYSLLAVVSEIGRRVPRNLASQSSASEEEQNDRRCTALAQNGTCQTSKRQCVAAAPIRIGIVFALDREEKRVFLVKTVSLRQPKQGPVCRLQEASRRFAATASSMISFTRQQPPGAGDSTSFRLSNSPVLRGITLPYLLNPVYPTVVCNRQHPPE
uniref:Uncharacterized protein n=1 Tax=Rhizochromulina marina TaxID=1034831 RepID=A0A7S2SS20_9STRA|mmetsp:Transcript_4867/g.14515  ORF Transcript_4867/g.14515 Transcript_4867/m.14515 type:complete len:378 (+) Transcript_4867:568-1701(+)